MAKDKTMFKLRRPCANCPFRTDVPGYLRRSRAVEIAQGIAGGSIFPCHETTENAVDDDGNDIRVQVDTSQFCAGAVIAMEKMEQPNQALRMAERFGIYDPAMMDMDAPVVSSFVEFVDHHGESMESLVAQCRDEEEDGEYLDSCCSIVNTGCEAPAGFMMGGTAVPADNEGVELHACPECGTTVCSSCADDDGVCDNCVEWAEEEKLRVAEREGVAQ
jgi:hypothetical protein